MSVLPVLGKAKRTAKIILCVSNIKQYTVGINIYAISNGGYFYPIPGNDGTYRATSPDLVSRNQAGAAAEATVKQFVEVMAGGGGEILFCPFQLSRKDYWGPDFEAPYYPQYFRYAPPANELYYYTGYCTYAGFGEWGGTWDWSNSGNGSSGSILRTRNSDSEDAIVTDFIVTFSPSDSRFLYAHQARPELYLFSDYRENNVGYIDGHTEIHRHTMNTVQGQNVIGTGPDWDGEKVHVVGTDEYHLW